VQKEQNIGNNQGIKNINTVLVVKQKNIKKNLRKKNIKVNHYQNHHLPKVQLLQTNNQILKIDLKMQAFLN